MLDKVAGLISSPIMLNPTVMNVAFIPYIDCIEGSLKLVDGSSHNMKDEWRCAPMVAGVQCVVMDGQREKLI